MSKYNGKYNAESPKHDRKRFNSQAKMKYFDDLGIIYLWEQYTVLYKIAVRQVYVGHRSV